MPTTYNGIGTHYYGKKNLDRRPGVCRHCNRNVELTSYDTRLWFVVLFIPIIPLGRKRIVDYCSACTRHYAVNLDKWETAKQLEISGALEQFRTHPTPEAAIAAHRQLLQFHQNAQAADFRKTMLQKFGDNPKVLIHLGAALEHLGQTTESAEYYQRALALRPDLPEARIGMARARIHRSRQGSGLAIDELNEARKLLDFLEKPGAAQLYSLEALEELAYALQTVGQHEQALQLFTRLKEELPAVAEHPGFRKAVQKSEKALGRTTTLLPKQKFSLRRIFQFNFSSGTPMTGRSLLVFAILLAIVAAGFAIANEYIRRHRTVFVLNAYKVPATVTLIGGGSVQNFTGVRELVVAEGKYQAVVSGPVQQQVEFEVRDSYFRRWFGHPAWVLNIGGAGLLMSEEVTYTEHNPPAPKLNFYVGQVFQTFPEITHPFKPLPETVELSRGSSRALVMLKAFEGDASDVLAYYVKNGRVSEAMDLAEKWLRLYPDDTDVLQFYCTTAAKRGEIKRADARLRSGLDFRPVRIEWHRKYQTLHNRPSEHAALAAEYDRLLQAEPDSAALLYLRGRIEPIREAQRYYERAMQVDAGNPYPLYALAYYRMAAGDWGAAKPLLARTVELAPQDRDFKNTLLFARFALGEAPAIEKEVRKQLEKDPADFPAQNFLVEALAAQNQPKAALQSLTAFETACRKRYGNSVESLIQAARYHALYSVGDFAGLQKAAAGDASSGGRATVAAALLEQGRVAEAAKSLPPDLEEDTQTTYLLALAVGYRQAGDKAEAERWRLRAMQVLEKGDMEAAWAAELLKRNRPPKSAELLDVRAWPSLKALMLVDLAQRYPQSRREYCALARRLNVLRQFPFHLVQQATEPSR